MEDGDGMGRVPKVSIIMPVYNAQNYLKESIQSVLSQTYENFELILVDDGSKDDSYSMCRAFADKDDRIRLFQKKNGGPGSARNYGLDNAKGDYILFADSDDVVVPDCLEILLSLMQENNADAVIYNFDILTPEGQLLESGEEHPIKDGVYSADELFARTYEKNGYMFSFLCNKLLKRACFNDLRFMPLRMCEDEVIFPRVMDRCRRICMTEKVLYRYYERSGSVMHQKFSARNFDQLFSYFDRYSFYLQTGRDALAHIAGKSYWENVRQHCIQYDFSDQNIRKELKVAKKHFNSVFDSLLKDPLLDGKEKLHMWVYFINPALYKRYIVFRSK